FIGELLVLIGSFRTEPVLALVATTAVIISPAYLLWAIQRILFKPPPKPENEHIPDLNRRELAIMVPLIACIVWLGVYPAPVLRPSRTDQSGHLPLVRRLRDRGGNSVRDGARNG